MKLLSKIVAVFGLLIFSAVVMADSKPQDLLAALDAAGVTYVSSTDGTLRILRTKSTAEAIESLKALLPANVDITDNLLEVE